MKTIEEPITIGNVFLLMKFPPVWMSLQECWFMRNGGARPAARDRRLETGGWRAADGLPLIFDAGFLAQIVIPAHQLVFMAHLVVIEPVEKLS